MKRPLSLLILPVALAAFAPAAEAGRHGPPRPPHAPKLARYLVPTAPAVIRPVESELKASTSRAEADARVQLGRAVAKWLGEDGVPASWTPPAAMLNAMVVGPIELEPVRFHDLDVFRATVRADFSPVRKHAMVEAYHHQVAGRRLAVLGGVLAFTLTCLGALAGYIRADEATKGYYTNHLRLAAAAGVGAAGTVVYQILT